jgi:uncharacterized membrane protein YfcA
MAGPVAFVKPVLLGALALVALAFTAFWLRSASRSPGNVPAAASRPGTGGVVIGFVTDFLDTLGIGSFATTTTAYNWTKLVDVRLIPGTMNVGHALPTAVQAFIYVTLIQVDMTTLVVMVAAAVAGGWLGSGAVSRWPRTRVRAAMAVALLVASGLLLLRSLDVFPRGGDSLGLTPPLLVCGAAANFVLGALMSAGIGLYGPCMIVVSLLGMNPTAAFPIMMSSCAFLMPVASLRFVQNGAYDLRAALGLTVGGIPGVLVAAYVVRSLPLDAVRWLVLVIAAYTGFTLLRPSPRQGREEAA